MRFIWQSSVHMVRNTRELEKERERERQLSTRRENHRKHIILWCLPQHFLLSMHLMINILLARISKRALAEKREHHIHIDRHQKKKKRKRRKRNETNNKQTANLIVQSPCYAVQSRNFKYIIELCLNRWKTNKDMRICGPPTKRKTEHARNLLHISSSSSTTA